MARHSTKRLPAADLPHVFERFYRVEKSRAAAPVGAGIDPSSDDRGAKNAASYQAICLPRPCTGGWKECPKPSSRPDQHSSVCSRPGSAKMATVCRLYSSRPDHNNQSSPIPGLGPTLEPSLMCSGAALPSGLQRPGDRAAPGIRQLKSGRGQDAGGRGFQNRRGSNWAQRECWLDTFKRQPSTNP